MTTQYKLSVTNGAVPTTLDDQRVRTNTLEVTSNAEEGSVATSSIVIDDPLGDFDIIGHRNFAIREMSVAVGSNSYIFVGATADRKVRRGPSGRVGVGREWEVSLVDINTFLERRVMVGLDNNRPAETDIARLQWLLTTAEGSFIGDTRYFNTSGGVAMDACDYRGQSFKSVIDDCAQQSGKNYFLTTFEDTATATQPWGVPSFFYDFNNSTAYSSTIALSNDSLDLSVNTFAISQEETFLTRDPSRVYSSVYVVYDGGTAYVNNNATVAAFARRDAVSPAENVKTAAKATARGTRYLASINTEEDVITTGVTLPAASVNLLREGMRVPFKATHLPGYETPQYTRVLNRTVKQVSEENYFLQMELGGGAGGTVSNVGQTFGGYVCTTYGYAVPLVGGDVNGVMYADYFVPGHTGNSLADWGQYCHIYRECTYQVHVYSITIGPIAPPMYAQIINASVWQVELGTNDTGFIPLGHPVPPLTDVVGSITVSGSYASDPTPIQAWANLIQLPWSAHDPANSESYTTLSYVSGPDPRFTGLPGCPLP